MRMERGGIGRNRAGFCAVACALAVAACSSTGSSTSSEGSEGNVASTSGPLNVAFTHASEHAAVPRDLLVAIARVEEGLGLPAQRLDIEAATAVPAAGPLMLRRGKLDTLARAAFLSGKTELELRKDTDLALDAGALVLGELGAKTGARADDLASWKLAIEEMSGYADDAHRAEYTHRVFAALARGGEHEGRDGEKIATSPHDLPPTLTIDLSSQLHTLTTAQFAGAEWIPTSCTNKCDAGRGGESVEYIVIHDTEGGWDASVSTLQNDSGKSVQYIVGTDGKVAQFVTEDTTAWHAGNYFYNQRSVGIEHVGYSSKPYTEAQYAASGKLVDYLAKKYAVARDRAHIIGHEQVPNGNLIAQSGAPCSTSPKTCEANEDYGGANHHTDPGVWEWATYMPRFGGNAKCDDVTTILNCSYDKKNAFKCDGGKVVVTACDGAGACEVKPTGQDDVCHTATKPTSTTPSVTTAPPATTGVAQTTGAPLPAPAADATDSGGDSGGCSVSRLGDIGSRGAGSTTSLVGLAVAAALVASRRRRAA